MKTKISEEDGQQSLDQFIELIRAANPNNTISEVSIAAKVEFGRNVPKDRIMTIVGRPVTLNPLFNGGAEQSNLRINNAESRPSGANTKVVIDLTILNA